MFSGVAPNRGRSIRVQTLNKRFCGPVLAFPPCHRCNTCFAAVFKRQTAILTRTARRCFVLGLPSPSLLLSPVPLCALPDRTDSSARFLAPVAVARKVSGQGRTPRSLSGKPGPATAHKRSRSDSELAEASKCRRTVSVCAPLKRCKAGTLGYSRLSERLRATGGSALRANFSRGLEKCGLGIRPLSDGLEWRQVPGD